MSYEVLNGKVGMTGKSLCVTIPKKFAEAQNIIYQAPIKKIVRGGIMLTVFKSFDDVQIQKLLTAIDKELGDS